MNVFPKEELEKHLKWLEDHPEEQVENQIFSGEGLRTNIEKNTYKPKPFNSTDFLNTLCGGRKLCLEELDKAIRKEAIKKGYLES